MTSHPIVHVEFSADDPKAAAEFYNEVFGWTIQDVPDMNYVMFGAEPGPGGGFPAVDGENIKAGDVLVQRGTWHNWLNKGDGPCVIAFALIDAQPVTVGGRTLEATIA